MTTEQLAASIVTFPLIAGRIADEVDAQAADVLEKLEALVAGITELRLHLAAGTLDSDVRTDIGGDLVAITDDVLSFSLAVAA